mgnify:CR=1 FL=1
MKVSLENGIVSISFSTDCLELVRELIQNAMAADIIVGSKPLPDALALHFALSAIMETDFVHTPEQHERMKVEATAFIHEQAILAHTAQTKNPITALLDIKVN